MSDILTAAKAHFAETSLKPIKVPEWGKTVYFAPPTFAEAARIKKGVSNADDTELMVRTVVHKCLDKGGKRVFGDDPETLVALQTQVDARVLQRILVAMGDTPEVGEVKNT